MKIYRLYFKGKSTKQVNKWTKERVLEINKGFTSAKLSLEWKLEKNQ